MKKTYKRIVLALVCIAVILALVLGVYMGNKLLNKANRFMDDYRYLSEQVERMTFQIEDSRQQYNGLIRTMDTFLDASNFYVFDYSWMESAPLIAHALGGVDEVTYTNSLEAFQHNYQLGHRIFEVDFILTDPEKALVAAHDQEDWRAMVDADETVDFTYTNFMDKKLYDAYTPLDCEGVIDLMMEYPDIHVVTDTKFSDKASVYLQFSQLVKCAQEKDPSVLDRLIPQIYTEEMLDWVMDVHLFQSVIFTLYQTDWTPESIYDFCERTNVRCITMHCSQLTAELVDAWDDLGVTIACYTSNDLEETQQLFDMGAGLMYTDTLTPDQFAK